MLHDKWFSIIHGKYKYDEFIKLKMWPGILAILSNWFGKKSKGLFFVTY